MQSSPFDFTNNHGTSIHVHRWLPDGEPKAVVQIAHGMQEHGARYEVLASALVPLGYAVYANDHQGHGASMVKQGQPGVLGPDGREGVLADMLQLLSMERETHPDLPIFLFGHSWGSFLTQRFIQLHGELLAGAILSGSNGSNPLVGIGAYAAQLVTAIRGEERTAVLLKFLSTGDFNKQFEPGKTGFEWLSRDEAAVQAYVDDPQCGVDFPNVFFREMVALVKECWQPAHEAQIPGNLPIYIFSGGQDPVGFNGKGIKALVKRYQHLGIQDLEYRVYPGGRHEMLNETNRTEVLGHIVDWLEKRTA